MSGIAIVGLQWGDEGKGKISAYLCRGADLVVRFNGGANAGHTVYTDNRVYKLHMLPAGSLTARSAAIGPGVYVDLDVLLSEIEELNKVRRELEVIVSPRAHVVLPIHKLLDSEMEEERGGAAIGTTRRGIGPAAMSKYARLGIRLADVLDGELLEDSIRSLIRLRPLRSSVEVSAIAEGIKLRIAKLADKLGDVGARITERIKSGGKVVFEGAQGTLLDIDHGTYPYVTSSSTLASAACSGSGIGPSSLHHVVGVVKAYTTRVGGGPLPTEMDKFTADEIREAGNEYGTTTGRPRRVGWLDMPMLRYASRLNGVDSIAMTKLDALSGVKRIKICVGYELDGKRIESIPETASKLERVKPIYAEVEGWPRLSREDLDKIVAEGYGALPSKARKYVQFVEEGLGVKVKLLSIGPNISDTLEI